MINSEFYKKTFLNEKELKYLNDNNPSPALFLDRDGVINFKAKKARYINFWSEFFFIPRVYKSLKKLSNAGYKFIIISNQAGIGLSLIHI